MLLGIAALAWRGAWVLSTRVPTRAALRLPDDLIDRSEETTTIGSIVTSLYSYRELLKNLVMKDLKLKYRGSVFGFLWSLANPLLMIVVYTIAFTYILRVRSERLRLLSDAGPLLLDLLRQLGFDVDRLDRRQRRPAEERVLSAGDPADRHGAVQPRAVPADDGGVPAGDAAWYRVPLSEPMLLFPVVLALQALFTIGIAMILATATAFFRDVRHLLEVALAVLFWTTPIVYELDTVPERLRLIVLISPMSPFVVAYQKIFYFRQWPEPTVWLVAVTYAVGAFIIGTSLVLAFEDRFTEQL